jgi:hypothetical protein
MTSRICDAHCHFFSTGFLRTLGGERGWPADHASDMAVAALGWDAPGSDEAFRIAGWPSSIATASPGPA